MIASSREGRVYEHMNRKLMRIGGRVAKKEGIDIRSLWGFLLVMNVLTIPCSSLL